MEPIVWAIVPLIITLDKQVAHVMGRALLLFSLYIPDFI
jgi:hypothetical protein